MYFLVDSPITWIGSENTVNAVSGIIRNINVVGKFVFMVQNALVGDFRVTGGKGRLSSEGSETDDADGPDIDLERWLMASGPPILGLDGLGGHKSGRSAAVLDDLGAASIDLGGLKLCGEAKVGQLEPHVPVEQEICGLDIAMDDVAFVVQILESPDQLLQVVLDLGLREPMGLPPVQHVLHGLIVAQFEDEEGAPVVAKGVPAANDIVVIEPTVDSGFSFFGLHKCVGFIQFQREGARRNETIASMYIIRSQHHTIASSYDRIYLSIYGWMQDVENR